MSLAIEFLVPRLLNPYLILEDLENAGQFPPRARID